MAFRRRVAWLWVWRLATMGSVVLGMYALAVLILATWGDDGSVWTAAAWFVVALALIPIAIAANKRRRVFSDEEWDEEKRKRGLAGP